MIVITSLGLAVLLSVTAIITDTQTENFSETTRNSANRVLVSPAAETMDVMHCLKARELNWIGDAIPALEKNNTFLVALRHDRQTYPGEDFVFLAIFESPRKGDIFELTREDHGDRRTYNLANNGSFVLGGKETAWPNEIFGGIWTHEYFEKNIRTLRHSRKNWLRLQTIQRPRRQVSCSYYGSAYHN